MNMRPNWQDDCPKCVASKFTCDEHHRPAQPLRNEAVWYLGWEISWNEMAHLWAGCGWDAYKGGCDLGAPRIQHDTFSDLLDEIEDYEDGALSTPNPVEEGGV